MIAVVLSGAGNRGAMEAGALEALFEVGVRPDLLVGSSAGAINAAYTAARPTLEGARRLSAIWRGIRREDVFPGGSASVVWRLSRRRDALYDPSGLERIIRRHLPYRRLEEAAVPAVVVATELETGREAWLDRGDAVRAILASAAIPGVFPPVEIGGVRHIDGGVANRLPVSVAVARGADAIYAVDVGFPCECRRAHRSAVDVVMQAAGIMGAQVHRLRADLQALGEGGRLVYVPLPCHLSLRLTDFSRTDRLIRDGYRYARLALQGGAPRPAWLEQPALPPAASA